MGTPIDLKREAYDRAIEVADGFWIIATRHRPGFSRTMPEVNNRCLIFRLTEEELGKPVLVVSNGVDPKVIPEARRLERETGLQVKHLISPGGGHHLMMPVWRDEFTNATVHVGPVRIPKINGARKLMQGERVRVMDLDDPLPEFGGQLDAALFSLLGFRDNPNPYEGGEDLTFFRMMREMMRVDSPVDELWLHHVATDTVIGGENLGWILSPQTIKGFPLMLRMMMKPNSVYVQKDARKVADLAQVAATWKRVVSWPCATLMGYHEPPGEGFVGDGRVALERAARDAGQLTV